MILKTCQRCGDTFEGPHNAKWCSQCRRIIDAECSKRIRERQKLNGIEIIMPDQKKCGHCGETKSASEFSRQKDRPNGLTGWCKACRSKKAKEVRDAQPKQPHEKILNGLYCKVCGTELVDAQKNICSDRECRLEDNRRRSYLHDSAKKVLRERKCKECGGQFTPEYGNQRRIFCSQRCLDRWNDRQRDRGGDLNGRARKHFKKLYGTVMPLMYQYINWRKVLERDNWVCGICGKPIDESKKCPDDDSPSVDHIVPLARGGAHVYANVQAAHFKCNWNKGDGVHV